MVRFWQLGGEGDSKSKYTQPPRDRGKDEEKPPQDKNKLPDELL